MTERAHQHLGESPTRPAALACDLGRTLRRFGLLALMFWLASGTVLGVEPQPGQVYAGGTRISVQSLGVSFTLPSGWQGALSPGGEAFVMQPASGQAFLVAVADTMSPSEAIQSLRGPIELDTNLQLQLDGSVQRDGEHLSARYTVAGQPALSARARARAHAAGVSAGFFLVADSQSIAELESVLGSAYASLQVKAPARPDPATSAGRAGDGDAGAKDLWSDYLKGKHILRFFTSTGYTEEQHIWLCSDGTFHRRFDGGGFGGGTPGASGAFQSHYDGKWQATGQGEHGTLRLHFNDSQVSEYSLRWDFAESRLYLDGKRWLHDENNVCR